MSLSRRTYFRFQRLQQLRDDHAAALSTQDKRQRQLDVQAREIETLKAELSQQMSRMQHVRTQHERMNADRDEQLAELAQDLKHVKQEANTFGRQLELLHQQKENLDARRQQSVVEVRRQQRYVFGPSAHWVVDERFAASSARWAS